MVLAAILSLTGGGAVADEAACRIGLEASGQFLTVRAIAVGAGHSIKGHYDMLVNVRRGTNASVSSQSGKFSIPAGMSGKNVILSSSRVFVPIGTSVAATLRLKTDAGVAVCHASH